MTQTERLNPKVKRAWKRLESEFPLWASHLDTRDGELEFAVPAPSGSKAGQLVVFSYLDQLWIRFSPPNLCYALDDEDEMISIAKQLVADEAMFVVVMKGDEWVETTLIRSQQEPETEPGRTVQVVSWTGTHDR